MAGPRGRGAVVPSAGLEPATFRFGGGRAVHCATKACAPNPVTPVRLTLRGGGRGIRPPAGMTPTAVFWTGAMAALPVLHGCPTGGEPARTGSVRRRGLRGTRTLTPIGNAALSRARLPVPPEGQGGRGTRGCSPCATGTVGAFGRTRTCNLLIRSQVLCPLSYEGECRMSSGSVVVLRASGRIRTGVDCLEGSGPGPLDDAREIGHPFACSTRRYFGRWVSTSRWGSPELGRGCYPARCCCPLLRFQGAPEGSRAPPAGGPLLAVPWPATRRSSHRTTETGPPDW